MDEHGSTGTYRPRSRHTGLKVPVPFWPPQPIIHISKQKGKLRNMPVYHDRSSGFFLVIENVMKRSWDGAILHEQVISKALSTTEALDPDGSPPFLFQGTNNYSVHAEDAIRHKRYRLSDWGPASPIAQ